MLSPPSIPRGFRDFPPEDMELRLEVMEEIRKVFVEYGFPPMDTPCLEYWDTLKGKYGEEAEGRLIWRFKDPFSEKIYALRYDLTVPLARYVAMHPELPLPFKRHQIGPVWRHEEPQRLRYREFIQADIDTVGSPYIEADAEIINALSRALERIGLGEHRIRLNHRALLRRVFEEKIGLKDALAAYRAIDKLDRIGIEGVYEELIRQGIPRDKAQTIKEIVSMAQRPNGLEVIEEYFRGDPVIEGVLDEMRVLLDLLEKPSRVRVDLSLVRGLDYYTGVIFEYALPGLGGVSIAGGGRYDGLIGLFTGGRDLPATGGSLGFERIMDIIVSAGRKPGYRWRPVYIVSHSGKAWREAWRLAFLLRERGIPVEIDIMRRSPAKQRKSANNKGSRFLIFLGDKEIARGTITLYDRETNARRELSIEEALGYIRSVLG